MNANPPVLALKGVSKRFGPVQALSDVDFEIHDGEVVALVGDNGAGKSTLVKAIAGIHGADDGQILFEGKEVKITDPPTPPTSASRPSTRTSPSATTSTWSRTSSWAGDGRRRAGLW